MKRLISICILAFAAQQAYAQKPYFSNYGNAELALNPATTGVDNLIGFNLNHRTERYNSGLKINTTNFQLQYTLGNKERTKKWGGVGIIAESDKVSEGIPFSSYSIKANLAYNLSLDDKNHLSAGTQFSFNQQGLSTGSFTTGSQWVANQGFDVSAGTGESFNNEIAHYFSAGAGILWHQTDEYNNRKHYAGIAAFHLNSPSLNFTDNEDIIPLRYTLMAGLAIFQQAGNTIYLDGMASSQQQVGFWSIGPRFRKNFKDNDAFDPFTAGNFDVFARYFYGDRLSIGTQISQNNFSLGFAIDLHLENAGQSASTEFSISVFKRINFSEKEEELIHTNYLIGESRDFDEENQPVFSQQSVISIEKEYQTNVTSYFSFELRKNFNYGFNETALNEEAKSYLDDIAVMLKANSALRLKVSGHTDNVGTEEANQIISEERAVGVTDYLQGKGIAASRLSVIGMGATQPLYRNDTEENKAKNRRVEFLIYAEKE